MFYISELRPTFLSYASNKIVGSEIRNSHSLNYLRITLRYIIAFRTFTIITGQYHKSVALHINNNTHDHEYQQYYQYSTYTKRTCDGGQYHHLSTALLCLTYHEGLQGMLG